LKTWACFELDEELTGHHHHFICSACGSVLDVQLPQTIEQQLDTALNRVAGKRHFTISAHRLDIIGQCETCIQDRGSPASRQHR